MTKEEFLNLLTKEVKSYKQILETANNEWIVKGFIDIDKFILLPMIQKLYLR